MSGRIESRWLENKKILVLLSFLGLFALMAIDIVLAQGEEAEETETTPPESAPSEPSENASTEEPAIETNETEGEVLEAEKRPPEPGENVSTGEPVIEMNVTERETETTRPESAPLEPSENISIGEPIIEVNVTEAFLESLESVEIFAGKAEAIKIVTPKESKVMKKLEEEKAEALIKIEQATEEVKPVEEIAEVFKKIDMEIEDGRPVIIAELTSPIATLQKIKIKKDESAEKIVLESNGVEATAMSGLKIEKSGLYMEIEEKNVKIEMLPNEAAEIVKKSISITSIKYIELKDIDKKPFYEVKGTNKAKLLAIVPVEIETETLIDAKSGKIESTKKPWWSFLLF